MSDSLLFVVTLVLLPLASYRVTRFVTKDTIAAPIFDPIRLRLEERWIAKRAGDDENLAYLFGKSETWNSKLAYGLSCAWCLGFWVSGLGSLLVSEAYGLDYLMFALLWLAVSTVVGLIGRIDSD